MASYRNALVNKKDTVSVYLGAKDATEVVAADKLKNLGSVGDIGGTKDSVEQEWYDTEKLNYPGDTKEDPIDIEQNILTVEDTKLNNFYHTGDVFPFAVYVHKQDGTVLMGRKGVGFISSYKIGGTKGEVMLAKYTITPQGNTDTTTTEPSQENDGDEG